MILETSLVLFKFLVCKKRPILFSVRRQGRDTIVIDFGYVLGRFLWLDSHGNACMLWKIVRGEAAFSSRKIVKVDRF